MMIDLRFGRHAFGVGVTLTMLVGCGGSQTAMSGTVPGTVPFGLQSHGESWMAPQAPKIRKPLYISDMSSDDVYVYNYKTGSLVGRLTGFYIPSGQCVDAKGDVWITDYQG
jgi:hypothetical protein